MAKKKGMGKRERAVYNQIDRINARIEAIANRFGLESQIYQEYLNKVKAVFPEKNTRVKGTSQGDVIQIRNIKANRTDAKASHQFKEALKLPTVRQYEQQIKRDIAYERGAVSFGEAERMARNITQQEVTQYVADKSLVYAYMEGGKIKYDSDDIGKALSEGGAKTYDELARILRGEELNEDAKVQEGQNAQSVVAQYEKGRVNIT